MRQVSFFWTNDENINHVLQSQQENRDLTKKTRLFELLSDREDQK